jgi:hypothetical protein
MMSFVFGVALGLALALGLAVTAAGWAAVSGSRQ